MAETRKYHIQHIDEATGKVVRERIIEATNRATARQHASNTTIAVELLDTDQAIRLTGLGITTEKADGAKPTTLKAHPDQLSLLTPATPPAATETCQARAVAQQGAAPVLMNDGTDGGEP